MATYYVGPTGLGSDARTALQAQNPATPWLTLQKFNNDASVISGDTCIVLNGTYTTSSSTVMLTASKSGLTYRAQNKRLAILSGNSFFTATGISVTGSNITIQDFECRGFNTTGMRTDTGCQNITFTGNWVHHIGNICSDTTNGFTGIFGKGTTNLLIQKNEFNHIGRLNPGESGCSPSQPYWQNNDHCIYIDSGSTINIINNLFYDHTHGWCIQLYPNALTGVNIRNNTFADPNPNRAGHVLMYSAQTNCDISNNIFYSPLTCGITRGSGTFNTHSNVTIRNNICFGGTVTDFTASGVTQTPGNLSNTNPLLADPANRNYRLAAASGPAYNAGATIASITEDFDGNARPGSGAYDIGAFEFTSGSTPDTTPPAAPTGVTIL
jgi:hypothetical protein